MGYLPLLVSWSGEYLFGGFPRLCLKGNFWKEESSILCKEEEFRISTSGIFSEDNSWPLYGEGVSESF